MVANANKVLDLANAHKSEALASQMETIAEEFKTAAAVCPSPHPAVLCNNALLSEFVVVLTSAGASESLDTHLLRYCEIRNPPPPISSPLFMMMTDYWPLNVGHRDGTYCPDS